MFLPELCSRVLAATKTHFQNLEVLTKFKMKDCHSCVRFRLQAVFKHVKCWFPWDLEAADAQRPSHDFFMVQNPLFLVSPPFCLTFSLHGGCWGVQPNSLNHLNIFIKLSWKVQHIRISNFWDVKLWTKKKQVNITCSGWIQGEKRQINQIA